MKSFLFSTFFLFAFFEVFAQGICGGNLGENIFERGDFGIGGPTILGTNPGIAPGYNYTTSVPFDGFYTICSNTAALSGLFPTWIAIQDNSNDPSGYMMVVNASFEPGIFYEEVVEGLCENTLYEFSADIINLIKIGTSSHIDPNVSFLIDNQDVYSTGNIPKTETWRQYGFSFTTTSTQSSITLTLRNNAPGGIGNDLALDNISFRPCGPSSFIGIESDTTIFLCIDDDPLTVVADIQAAEGQEFAIQWQESEDGINWTTLEDSTENTLTHTNFIPGDYYYRYYSAANEINILNEKCRIISDIIEISILPDTYNVTDTICEGLVYEFGNQQLVSSGPYEESFQSQYGCDSIVFLDLVFIPPQEVQYDITLVDPSCYGFDDGDIVVNSLTGGNGGLTYLFIDDQGMQTENVFPAGVYSLEVTDQYGCQDAQNLILIDPPEISVSIGEDTMIKLGDELFLEPDYSTDFTTITWAGLGEFSCLDCENPFFVPFFSGQLEVIVQDDNGCQAKDSLWLTIDDENFVILPNIFSPNGDNINDFLTINYYGRSVARVLTFKVFDRWGGVVFDESNLELSSGEALWDGYMKSKQVETGVYSYLLEVLLINDVKISKIGNVTLLK